MRRRARTVRWRGPFRGTESGSPASSGPRTRNEVTARLFAADPLLIRRAQGRGMSFSYRRVEVAPAVSLNVAVCGSGRPVVLLHGFPQTHLMWRLVAPRLAAAGYSVICPDLRGYGDSDKPDGTDAYAKRGMAADVVALARALGHERFALAGHDRGALVAIRAGLDHPEHVTHLAALDVLPTLDSWEVLHGTAGVVGFHLYLMAAPAPLPELLI